MRNAKQVEFFGGGRWREVVSPDGVRCYVTRLWGNAAKAASPKDFEMPIVAMPDGARVSFPDAARVEKRRPGCEAAKRS